MSLFPTILYPTDLSTSAEAARPLAFELARHSEALHLLYVDSLFGRAEHAREVRRHLAELGAEASVPVEADVVRDLAPASAILHYAQSYDADLIVMGTHGRRGISRLLLGSTAREVVQFAPCPVLTVRHEADEAARPGLQGGSILVAIDFSATSREALCQAVRLAEAFDARVDLLHVIEELFRPVGHGYTLRSIYEVEPDIQARLGEALRVFRDEVAGDFQHFGPMEILPGPPAEAIAEVAERLGSSLLVLGTKGLRGLNHLLMGSVAEAVVRTAPCPVLSVKTPEATTAARSAIQAAAEPSPSDDLLLRIEPLPVF